jgi:hypothetical protein
VVRRREQWRAKKLETTERENRQDRGELVVRNEGDAWEKAGNRVHDGAVMVRGGGGGGGGRGREREGQILELVNQSWYFSSKFVQSWKGKDWRRRQGEE